MPLVPLAVATRVVRPGRKVRLAFHSDAVDDCFVAGAFETPGPDPTPRPPTSAAASAVLSRLDGWQFINPD